MSRSQRNAVLQVYILYPFNGFGVFLSIFSIQLSHTLIFVLHTDTN